MIHKLIATPRLPNAAQKPIAELSTLGLFALQVPKSLVQLKRQNVLTQRQPGMRSWVKPLNSGIPVLEPVNDNVLAGAYSA
jgi:hypothetical protein